MSSLFLSTRHQRFACARLPDPHLTHQVRLFPHRSPRQSSANAAVGGLEPLPAERLRRAYLHLPRSTASRGSTYVKLLSAFVTHTCGNRLCPRHRGAVERSSGPFKSVHIRSVAPDLLHAVQSKNSSADRLTRHQCSAWPAPPPLVGTAPDADRSAQRIRHSRSIGGRLCLGTARRRSGTPWGHGRAVRGAAVA
jgi:hypothetical protein